MADEKKRLSICEEELLPFKVKNMHVCLTRQTRDTKKRIVLQMHVDIKASKEEYLEVRRWK